MCTGYLRACVVCVFRVNTLLAPAVIYNRKTEKRSKPPNPNKHGMKHDGAEGGMNVTTTCRSYVTGDSAQRLHRGVAVIAHWWIAVSVTSRTSRPAVMASCYIVRVVASGCGYTQPPQSGQ